MGVTFEDMVRKSMRQYWLKTNEYDQMPSQKGTKYNKKYFDSLEKDTLPADTKLTKPSIPKVDISSMKGLSPSGPIPGENYTSDTKNYPWHRPPEVTSLDQGIELAGKQLMSEDSGQGLITMLSVGLDVATLTDIFVTSGIGAGKWTPDFAILLAGPVSHIIQLLAKANGIDPDLGIDLPKQTRTRAYVQTAINDQVNFQNVLKALDDPTTIQAAEAAVQKQAGGFMGMGEEMLSKDANDPQEKIEGEQ